MTHHPVTLPFQAEVPRMFSRPGTASLNLLPELKSAEFSLLASRSLVPMVVLLLASLFVTPGITPAHASASVVTTKSSAICQIGGSKTSFNCSVQTDARDVIVVFFGCLTKGSGCKPLSVKDSQQNTYTAIATASNGLWCYGSVGMECAEEAFWARASAGGMDTISFTSQYSYVLGADVYVVSGISTIGVRSSTGTSTCYGYYDHPCGQAPRVDEYTPYPNGFVAAGVIAENSSFSYQPGEFLAGNGYTLISGQPCYCRSEAGGWQGSEYEMWTGGTTNSTFGYPSENMGWAEVSVSFSNTSDSATVSCSTSPASSLTPAVLGRSSVCTAAVAGNSPTGTVKWTTSGTGTFSPSSCVLSSSGACQVAYAPSNPHSPVTITASYSGDDNNDPAIGTLSLSVSKAVTTTFVVCTPSPVSVGATATCTVTVVGYNSPSGIVTWTSSSGANFSLSSCTLSLESCSVRFTPSSPLSPVNVTATYFGDEGNAESEGHAILSVTTMSTGLLEFVMLPAIYTVVGGVLALGLWAGLTRLRARRRKTRPRSD